jgi:hypothetical protein
VFLGIKLHSSQRSYTNSVNNNNNNNNNMLIDVAVPGDRNVIQKEAEKILKCEDLTIEIQRM